MYLSFKLMEFKEKNTCQFEKKKHMVTFHRLPLGEILKYFMMIFNWVVRVTWILSKLEPDGFLKDIPKQLFKSRLGPA